MLNGNVYQVEGQHLNYEQDGALTIFEYGRTPAAIVAAGQWRIVGEWLKAQKMEVNATDTV